MPRYMTEIARLCERIDNSRTGRLKALTTYELCKDVDTYKLFHYGTYLGGVRPSDSSWVAILGYPISVTDSRALNTLWKYFRTGRRVRIRDGQVSIYPVDEDSEAGLRL